MNTIHLENSKNFKIDNIYKYNIEIQKINDKYYIHSSDDLMGNNLIGPFDEISIEKDKLKDIFFLCRNLNKNIIYRLSYDGLIFVEAQDVHLGRAIKQIRKDVLQKFYKKAFPNSNLLVYDNFGYAILRDKNGLLFAHKNGEDSLPEEQYPKFHYYQELAIYYRKRHNAKIYLSPNDGVGNLKFSLMFENINKIYESAFDNGIYCRNNLTYYSFIEAFLAKLKEMYGDNYYNIEKSKIKREPDKYIIIIDRQEFAQTFKDLYSKINSCHTGMINAVIKKVLKVATIISDDYSININGIDKKLTLRTKNNIRINSERFEPGTKTKEGYLEKVKSLFPNSYCFYVSDYTKIGEIRRTLEHFYPESIKKVMNIIATAKNNVQIDNETI